MTQTHRPCYKTNEDLICPECNLVTGVTDKKTGDIICERCGLILSERNVDPSHTRRMPTREGKEDRCRTGPLHLPTTLYFSSTIRKKDILHLSITNEQRESLFRIRKRNYRTHRQNIPHSLILGKKIMRMLVNNLHIPKAIYYSAFHLLKRAVSKGISRGYSVHDLVCAVLFICSREHKYHVSLQALTEAIARQEYNEERKLAAEEKCLSFRGRVKVKKQRTFQTIRTIVEELHIEYNKEQQQYTSHIIKLCNQTKAYKQVRDALRELVRKLPSKITAGKNPWGIVAASLYFLNSEFPAFRVLQKDLARFTGLTEATIRNRYREIKNYINKNRK